MRRAVVLLSSGLDSAANLVLGPSAVDAFQPVAALTVNYGQRGAASEIARGSRLAARFGLEHRVFDVSAVFPALVASKSALLGGGDVPRIGAANLDDHVITTSSAAAVWVPNRNGLLIGFAAAWAESRGWDAVAVGFNAEEAVTFPDNSAAYMKAATTGLFFSTANHVAVVSATVHLTKKEIVAALAHTDFPFELLWSCYHAAAKHCGQCESCLRLRRALALGLEGRPALPAILHSLFGETHAS